MHDESAAIQRKSERGAVIALIFATVFWGCGFTWAKEAGEVVNHRMGLGNGAMLGPVWILAWRFLSAGLIWLAIFPNARPGVNLCVFPRALILGAMLATGLVVQHLGLDRTSEAVTAFLTSLTILFVPVLAWGLLRKPPAALLWAGVLVATAGIWLLTGAAATGFGPGEALGL